MIATYMTGSLVRESVTFLDSEGVPTDASGVTLTYRRDAGAVITLTLSNGDVSHLDTGSYFADLDTSGWDGPGVQLWTLEWVADGNLAAITGDSFAVTPPAIN